MIKENFTYQIKKVILGIILWELVFWLLFFAFLWIMGYYDYSNVGTKLAFTNKFYFWLLFLLIPVIFCTIRAYEMEE
jgi:hypothetical protein